MKPATIKLHEGIIRLARGMLNLWEEYLNQQRKLI